MPEKSKLYDRETAQRVIDKYPEFPQFNQEKCLDILRMVYSGIVQGKHTKQMTYWQIQARARSAYKGLEKTLKDPSRLPREPKPKKRKQTLATKLECGQTSLFDGEPHTW